MSGSVLSAAAPALDPGVLLCLARDVEDEGVALQFATCYRHLLAGRVTRIAGSLDLEDPTVALDATLSLKVSSATVGARELAELAREIEQALRAGDPGALRAAADRLSAAWARADVALAEYLATSAAELLQRGSSIR
jgi:HPt (histidine-containing phosphotransfer) domain-containing protein